MIGASYSEILLAICVLTLPFLYDSRHVFRYHLKFAVYYVVVSLIAVVLIPIFALRPCNVRNLLIASSLCHHVSTLLGLKWRVENANFLKQDQSFIIVSNHQSSIDVLGLFELWPLMDKCTVVSKREVFWVWPFGIAAWLCGLIFIPRSNSTHEAISILNETGVKIKSEKIKLWVFPEGTRRNTGQIHPFKKGAFHLALTAQIPILPVVFSQYYFLNKKDKRFDHHGNVLITVLPPVAVENKTINQLNDVMDDVRRQMNIAFQKSNLDLKQRMMSEQGSDLKCF